MRKGINLVVLVITIVVMLILAGTVVLFLTQGNIIEKSNESVFKSDAKTFEEELSTNMAKREIRGLDTDIDVPYASNPTYFNSMKEYIPSYTEEYTGQFEIRDGELVFIGDDEYIEWVSDIGMEEDVPFIERTAEETGTVSSDWVTEDITGGVRIIRYRGSRTADITIPNTLVINGEKVLVKEFGQSNTGVAFFSADITGTLTVSNGLILDGGNIQNKTGITKVVIEKNVVINNEGGGTNCGMFYNCTGIEDIVIGNNVIIDEHIFADCTGIKKVKIGDDCTLEEPFGNCTADILTYTIGERLRCKEQIFRKNILVENFYTATPNTTYIKAKNVKEVSGTENFCICTNIDVSIDDSVTSIGENSFYNAQGNLIVKGTLTNVESRAFSGCTALKGTVNIGNGAIIGEGAFKNCSNADIVINGTITEGREAFIGCKSVTRNP